MPTNASEMPSRTRRHPRRREAPRGQERLQADERERDRDGQPRQRELRRALDRENGQGDRHGEEELRIALEANRQPRRAQRGLGRAAVTVLEEEARRRVPLGRRLRACARHRRRRGLGGRGVRVDARTCSWRRYASRSCPRRLSRWVIGPTGGRAIGMVCRGLVGNHPPSVPASGPRVSRSGAEHLALRRWRRSTRSRRRGSGPGGPRAGHAAPARRTGTRSGRGSRRCPRRRTAGRRRSGG